MKSRLKLYLPVLQVGVSLVLGLWGDWQTQRLLRQLGTSHVWDYVAPAEMVMHLINLPAMLACTLTLSRSFQIGIEYSVRVFVGYLAFVAALWFSVGWCIQDYPRLVYSRSSTARALRVFGVLLGVLTILLGAILLKGQWPLSILFPLGFIVWGIAFIVLFSRKAASSDGV